jgi:hypothetical protein
MAEVQAGLEIQEILDQLGIEATNSGASTGSFWYKTNGETIDSFSPVDGKLIDPLKTAEAKEAFYAGLLADSLFPLNYVGLGQIELREGNGGKADTYFAKARSIVDNKKFKASKDLKYTTYIAIAAANIAEKSKNLNAAKTVLDALAEIEITNQNIETREKKLFTR